MAFHRRRAACTNGARHRSLDSGPSLAATRARPLDAVGSTSGFLTVTPPLVKERPLDGPGLAGRRGAKSASAVECRSMGRASHAPRTTSASSCDSGRADASGSRAASNTWTTFLVALGQLIGNGIRCSHGPGLRPVSILQVSSAKRRTSSAGVPADPGAPPPPDHGSGHGGITTDAAPLVRKMLEASTPPWTRP